MEDFTRPLERTGRVISPSHADWLRASEVVTRIERKDRAWRSKLPALLNDILIALCPRRAGATVLTHNKDDFQLIRRRLEFTLRILIP